MGFLAPVIGFVGSAIGAVGSFIGGLGIVGKAALVIGLNVAAGWAQKQLSKGKQQQQTVGGVKLDRQYGGDVNRVVACGLVGVAGHDVHVNTYDKSNGILQQVYTLSDYYSDGLSRVAINGEWVSLGSTPHPERGLPVTSGDFGGFIWIKFRDGRQTAAHPALVAHSNPSERWTANHIGVGITDVIVTMVYDEKKNNAFPDFFFEFRGAPCYDWRKDSSVGGNGPHRWNDKSTHEWTENPIVIEYNYRRGFSINNDVFCGMEMPASDLPLDRFTVAANLCDEVTAGERRYRASIMLDCMAQHRANIEALMLACGGMTIDGVDGSWPLVGSAQPIVATITDDDLVVGAPVRYRERRSMGELVNTVSGTSPDPAKLWAMTDYETQTSSALVTTDRRSRDVPIEFPQVPSKRQAGQLAGIYLEENRWEATAEIVLRPRWQVLKTGDWIRWNSARYGNKVYLITESSLRSLDGDGPRNNQVSLQQRDGSIYDDVIAPPNILPWPPGRPEYQTEAEDFRVVPASAQGADGDLRAAFRATWLPFDDLTVTGLEIRYWPSDQENAIYFHPVIPRDQTVTTIVAGVTSRTRYKFQSRLVTDPPRQVNWSAEIEVMSENAPIRDIAVELGKLQQDVRDELQRKGADIDRTMEELRKAVANIASRDTSDIIDVQRFEKRIGSNSAKISEERRLRVSADEAFAQQLIEVQTEIEENIATAISSLEATVSQQGDQITALSTSLDAVHAEVTDLTGTVNGQATAIGQLQSSVTQQGNDISAMASSLTSVEAKANQATANGLISWVAQAGPGGTSTRFTLQGKAAANGASHVAGIYVDVYPTYSQTLMLSSRFIVTDGTAAGTPFVFENSELKLAAARIATVVFDQLRSANGKLVMLGFSTHASIEITQ